MNPINNPTQTELSWGSVERNSHTALFHQAQLLIVDLVKATQEESSCKLLFLGPEGLNKEKSRSICLDRLQGPVTHVLPAKSKKPKHDRFHPHECVNQLDMEGARFSALLKKEHARHRIHRWEFRLSGVGLLGGVLVQNGAKLEVDSETTLALLVLTAKTSNQVLKPNCCQDFEHALLV